MTRGDPRALRDRRGDVYFVSTTLVTGAQRSIWPGRFYGRFVHAQGQLLLRERHCVYDTLLIDNALVMPV